MTVRDIRQMSNDEFTHWCIYYAREAQEQELERLKGGGK